ncbi:hypothetical protein EDD86DRAFT_249164 [Gorgonomyces haynaldii]|nr:hypothetical protein EDD86DRAFT_249164 [Gorgonomyces haynaldii]
MEEAQLYLNTGKSQSVKQDTPVVKQDIPVVKQDTPMVKQQTEQKTVGNIVLQQDYSQKVAKLIEELATREREEQFSRIYDQNTWGSSESRSGTGSHIANTRNVRSLLAKAIQEFTIQKFVDAPCGDCNWQPKIEGLDKIQYFGFDIVPQLIQSNIKKFSDKTNMHFGVLDFSNHQFPVTPDLVLCRDMIQHNTLKDGVRAYANIEQSGAKYLVTTWHDHPKTDKPNQWNRNIMPGDFYEVDIFLHPFNFSKPLFWISEHESASHGVETESRKRVGVFKLPALGMGDGLQFEMDQKTVDRSRSEMIDKAFA